MRNVYDSSYCVWAAKIAASGATDYEIAREMGIDYAVLFRWRYIHPEFRKALKNGRAARNDRVADALYRRALGYDYETTKITKDGEIIKSVEHVPPDTAAAKFWLTNRVREDWAERAEDSGVRITVTIPGMSGEPAVIATIPQGAARPPLGEHGQHAALETHGRDEGGGGISPEAGGGHRVSDASHASRKNRKKSKK